MKDKEKRYSVSRQTARLVEIYDILQSLPERTLDALATESYRGSANWIMNRDFKEPYREMQKAMLKIISQSISDHRAAFTDEI